MIICYILSIAWAIENGPLMGLMKDLPAWVPNIALIITPLHLIEFLLYRIVLTVILVFGGEVLCNLILGKEWPKYMYGGHNEDETSM